MIADPAFYAVAVPAVILVGMSKGGFGGGLALLAVPLMSLSVPPIKAAGILLPILCVMDIAGLLAYRRRVDWRTIGILLPAAIVGIGVGWATAAWVTDAHVRLMVGVTALAFVASHFARRRSAGTPQPHSRPWGSLWGFVSGFTSFISHAGGPPSQIYMLPLRLEPQLFAGTSIVLFSVINAVKLPPYFLLGQFDAQNLTTSLALLPLAIAAVWLGIWLVRVVSAELFYRLAYATVLVVGVKLVWDGIAGLLA
jgi:uncharacterized membrane protein YfcA